MILIGQVSAKLLCLVSWCAGRLDEAHWSRVHFLASSLLSHRIGLNLLRVRRIELRLLTVGPQGFFDTTLNVEFTAQLKSCEANRQHDNWAFCI